MVTGSDEGSRKSFGKGQPALGPVARRRSHFQVGAFRQTDGESHSEVGPTFAQSTFENFVDNYAEHDNAVADPMSRLSM